jgi:hypothetical protein
MNELIIPPAAAEDPKSIEVMRCWVASKALHVSLKPETWPDPAAWGIVLADVIRHLADAYNKSYGKGKNGTIRQILSLQKSELNFPTDEPTGDFVE